MHYYLLCEMWQYRNDHCYYCFYLRMFWSFVPSSLSKQVTVMFGDKDTISLLRKTAKKGPKLLGQPVPGVSINITFCPTADNNVDCVVDCRGEVLSQQTLPADW